MNYWYVKDEFRSKIYFKSNDLNKCQHFANHYNKTHKFAGQRMFKFNLYSFTSVDIFNSHYNIIDVNKHTLDLSMFHELNYLYKHPLATKNFHKLHLRYLKFKLEKIKHLCKKYHLWSYNKHGRKYDGFDF